MKKIEYNIFEIKIYYIITDFDNHDNKTPYYYFY